MGLMASNGPACVLTVSDLTNGMAQYSWLETGQRLTLEPGNLEGDPGGDEGNIGGFAPNIRLKVPPDLPSRFSGSSVHSWIVSSLEY